MLQLPDNDSNLNVWRQRLELGSGLLQAQALQMAQLL